MPEAGPLSTNHAQLLAGIQLESTKFQEYYIWLEKSMPPLFFEEVRFEDIMLITHSLMGFHLQDYFSTINLRKGAIVMCLDRADADLKILESYSMHGIKTYQAYVSSSMPPFPGVKQNLRIATIYFTEAHEEREEPYPEEDKKKLRSLVKQRNPQVTDDEFEKLICSLNLRFLRALPVDRLILALDMFFRAKTRDNCQYEVRYNEDWKEKGTASMQIVLAWRNTPKHHFLYRLARVVHRYGLFMKKVNVSYVDPYSKNSILVMALGLHGSNGEAVWDVADIPNFLRELVTVKYFASFDKIDDKLIGKKAVPSQYGNFLRSCVNFCHQALVHIDPHMYSIEKIEEDLCRHPELTLLLCEAFKLKFDPDAHDIKEHERTCDQLIKDIEMLDTGNILNDTRRKNVLTQALNLVRFTYKTNYFRLNYTAICFRLDPKYMDEIPFDRKKKFPELPYGIFFFKGMHFFGFHIRFKDLSRGGLRTVYPQLVEQIETERNSVFTECYNLAYTQQKKNKDIPEGGSKGVIFLKPFDRLESETLILRRELEETKMDSDVINQQLKEFRKEQRGEFLHQAQRSYIESLITIVNCDPDGRIRAKYMVDYWNRPEYIYLGPDENMHDSMIKWIAEFSRKYDYKPREAFISGKPKLGINHKEYGVTSLGVNVYMHIVLEYLGIDPTKDAFKVKISGGPDGDVAGNQINNLHRFYPDTAKLCALTDVSGTIYDPEGLDLSVMVELFKQAKPIKYYPPEKLNEGGYLLDRFTKREETAFAQQTLCWRMKGGELFEDWISGNEMNHLFRNNVHQAKVDVFIPAGGRPRTLNQSNIKGYLDEKGEPTSKAIIEGANLYLTPRARHYLQDKGVIIIKDSSANKGGVICSSFEVLSGLTLGPEIFVKEKEQIVKEVLERLKECGANEAHLLLKTYKEQGGYLTTISDEASQKINQFTYEILDYLDPIELSEDPKDPLIQVFLSYALSSLKEKYQEKLLNEIPDHHKKAIIACHIAANLVYKKGMKWSPSIVDILPIILQQKDVCG